MTGRLSRIEPRRLSRIEPVLNARATVGMVINGHNRIVEGVKGERASEVCRDEGIHINVHGALQHVIAHEPRSTRTS
jgi:hypothetical protein